MTVDLNRYSYFRMMASYRTSVYLETTTSGRTVTVTGRMTVRITVVAKKATAAVFDGVQGTFWLGTVLHHRTLHSRCVNPSAVFTAVSCSWHSVPRTRLELGKRSFAVAAPAAWNNLPDDVRSIYRLIRKWMLDYQLTVLLVEVVRKTFFENTQPV